MFLNQNNRLIQAVRRNAPYIVAALAIGIAGYMVAKPKAEDVLELPSVSEKKLRPEETSCVDGVRYLNTQGTPSAALVGSDGYAAICSDMKDAGLDQLNRRYRIFCVDRVQVVKVFELRNPSLFVRYDSNTRLPMACDL